jgi:predicted patatin/cPLA2 family phospholipase
MKHLGISGGGTKIAGLFGVAETLMIEKQFKPDVISGISAGAILSLPLALGKFNEVRKLVLNFTLDDFFSKPPVQPNGKFTLGALWRMIVGDPYLGKQGNLEKKLKALISEEEYIAYQNDNAKPACVVGAVDFITGSRKFFNLKKTSYEDFPRVVNASSSLPIFTNAIKMQVDGEKTYLFDGGVRDHIASLWIMEDEDSEFKGKISETVNVYSRPEDFKVLSDEFDDKNVISILSRYVDITNVEISKTDEVLINAFCKREGISFTNLYLPRVMKSVYDTDPGRLNKIYNEGLKEGRKYQGAGVVV